jgi:hypothetical protein
MTLREFWVRITSTRYTRALEAEVQYLRAENRALLNSILGIAGVPPISVLPGEAPAGRALEAPATAGVGAAAGNGTGPKIAVPMRRRSWQQINRMLEMESGLKKRRD